jgi:hypothetical protein
LEIGPFFATQFNPIQSNPTHGLTQSIFMSEPYHAVDASSVFFGSLKSGNELVSDWTLRLEDVGDYG